MANKDCNNETKHLKDENCCDNCPPGTFLEEECTKTKETKCSPCPAGKYIDQWNTLKGCILCNTCRDKNSFQMSNCTAKKKTVCVCSNGFYLNSEHCEPWTKCPVGKGVKVQPTSTNNTVCTPCENGTFSNVEDYSSTCKQYTRCEDIGQQLETPGTSTTDAICGFKSSSDCPWILPAGLWAGLVLTIVVVAAFLLCRRKRRSYRTGKHVPNIMEFSKQISAPPELLSHCQDTCGHCKQPLPDSDNSQIINIEDSLVNSCPISGLKASVSFSEANYNTSSTKHYTNNFHRCPSEPQEDEWCGT